MDQILEIIRQLTDELNNKKQQMLDENIPAIDSLKEKISIFDNIYNNLDSTLIFKNFEINEDDYLPADYNNLLFIKRFVSFSGRIPDEYKCDIQNILKRSIDSFRSKIEAYQSVDVSQIDDDLVQLSQLQSKLLILDALTEEDINTIVEICSNRLSKREINMLITDIMKQIIQKLYSSREITNVEHLEEEIEENIDLLTDDDLNDLFKDFNYDYNHFSQSAKIRLKAYGKLNNIREILEVFKQYNINLNTLYKNSTIIKSIGNNLVNIFVYSSKKYTCDILKIASDIGILSGPLFELIKYLSNSSKFYPAKRRSSILRSGNGGLEDVQSESIPGKYDNFYNNVRLIFNLYRKSDLYLNHKTPNDVNLTSDEKVKKYFVSDIYSKRENFFESSYTGNLAIINLFDAYNIDSKQYITTLSSFGSNKDNYASKLDQILELDAYDYFKDNLSRLVSSVYEPIVSQLIILKQGLKLDNNKIFEPWGAKLRYNKTKIERIFLNHSLDFNNPDISVLKFYQLDSQYVEKFKLLDEIVKEEYDASEIDFFSNLDGNLNFLDKLKDQTPYLNILDEKYQDSDNDLIYRINGVAVSKYKVKRVYNILLKHHFKDDFDCLLYAILKNSSSTKDDEKKNLHYSNFTQEQYDMILNELKKIKNKGVVR